MSSKKLNSVISQRMESVFPLNLNIHQHENLMKTWVSKNLYDEHTNPNGVINLGVALSYICDDIISEKLGSVKLKTANYIKENKGIRTVSQSLSEFYARKLDAKQPALLAENLILTNGLSSTMDVLAHVIADPGEVICTPSPSYAYFHRNFFIRSGVAVVPIDLIETDGGLEGSFKLTAKKVEDGVRNIMNQGKVVRAFVLTNPCNPFGTVYSESLILEIMEVCAKLEIHIIIDECGHLSVFKDGVQYKSVVAFDDIPDPNRTHVLWSFTKDLSNVGARMSAIFSFSSKVIECFRAVMPFYETSSYSQNVCQAMVDDTYWCDEVYFPSLNDRLRASHQLLADGLTKLGATVHPAVGGFTLVVSFRKFLRKDTFEEEFELLMQFLKYGVYVLAAQFMFCSQPGWFRIVFSYPLKVMEIAMKRIEDAIVNYSGDDFSGENVN